MPLLNFRANALAKASSSYNLIPINGL